MHHETMNLKHQTYFGITIQSISTEDFNLSLTVHQPNSITPKHAHEKPYLSLLINGNYEEESHDSTTIKNGFAIYRRADYEHQNSFSNQEGICLNLEINNPEEFVNGSDFRLPDFEIERQGSIDIYKLLCAFKNNIPKDILNIYCYESLVSHFDMLHYSGKLDWINKIKEYISDDPHTFISLNNLSTEFNLHPNYIVRKFKENTGYKLSEYLSKIRLESSLQKLIHPENKLTDIALDSGFYDQSHFNRTFKKHLQISPNTYRKLVNG